MIKRLATYILAALIYLAAANFAHAQTGGGFPPAKPYIQILCANTGAACSASGLKVGSAAAIWSTNSQTRVSTTTLSVDTVLQFTNVPAGKYQFILSTDGTAAGNNGGINFGLGGAGLNNYSFSGVYGAGSSVAAVMTIQTGGSQVGGGTTGNFTGLTIQGTFSVVSAGAVGLNWAQFASNVTATTLPNTVASFTIVRLN